MKFRDLTIVPTTPDVYTVISCDVSAGIGAKPHDALAVPTELTGAFCTRVALFELLAVGAEPQAIIHTVGNEYSPTAEASLRGVMAELQRAGLSGLDSNGSCEKNMTTVMTAVSVTAIGRIAAAEFQGRKEIKAGNYLYVVGVPLVGAAVLERAADIATYEELYALRQDTAVVDIVPVGSGGIRRESAILAAESGLVCRLDTLAEDPEMTERSGGPSTAVLAAVRSDDAASFGRRFPQARRVGIFIDEGKTLR